MTTTRLVGIPELAAALEVDQSTVNRRIKRGELMPFTTVGNRALFLASDVDALKRSEQHLSEKEK